MGVSVGSSIYNAPSIYESGAGGGGGDEGLPIAEIYNFPSGYTPLDKLVFDGKPAERVQVHLDGYRSSFNKTDNICELIGKINDITQTNSLFRYVPITPNDNVTKAARDNSLSVYSNSSYAEVFRWISNNLLSQKFTLKYTYNKLWLNEHSENISWFTTINTKDSICICSSSSEHSRVAYMDIFSFKIYNPNGNIIFFGVPAFDEANEKDGLLDIITNEFFPHEWYE